MTRPMGKAFRTLKVGDVVRHHACDDHAPEWRIVSFQDSRGDAVPKLTYQKTYALLEDVQSRSIRRTIAGGTLYTTYSIVSRATNERPVGPVVEVSYPNGGV